MPLNVHGFCRLFKVRGLHFFMQIAKPETPMHIQRVLWINMMLSDW